MNRELFVRNIKRYCEKRGVKPTVACRESGVGSSFINNIEARGQTPSIEKVYKLATYLGVTLNDLVGEDVVTSPKDPGLTEEELRTLMAYRQAPAALQAAARRVLGLE